MLLFVFAATTCSGMFSMMEQMNKVPSWKLKGRNEAWKMTRTEYDDLLNGDVFYSSLGCWKDDWNRAAGQILDPRHGGRCPFLGHRDYHNLPRAVELCAKCASFAGYEVFAVEDTGLCFGSANAKNTYRKHGPATGCRGGVGGPLMFDAYRVVGGNEGSCRLTMHNKRNCYGGMGGHPFLNYFSAIRETHFGVEGTGTFAPLRHETRSLELHGACSQVKLLGIDRQGWITKTVDANPVCYNLDSGFKMREFKLTG